MTTRGDGSGETRRLRFCPTTGDGFEATLQGAGCPVCGRTLKTLAEFVELTGCLPNSGPLEPSHAPDGDLPPPEPPERTPADRARQRPPAEPRAPVDPEYTADPADRDDPDVDADDR